MEQVKKLLAYLDSLTFTDIGIIIGMFILFLLILRGR